MLEHQVMTSENVNITSCVCLGLGSLAGVDGAKASWYELVALISILDILKEKYQIEHVYFQDPTFNDMDKTFLAKLGYTVLERPDASNKMNQDTFLFAPHLEYKHIAAALEIAHPSLYMGTALEFWVDTATLKYRDIPASSHDRDTNQAASRTAKEIFQSYLETHSSYCMPPFDGDHWWRYMGISWTPPTGSAVEPMVGMARWSVYH
ncbi:hypothetical protein MMC07_004218 [Pseudocyphellaria aurata]|nr:hypothetical protein [Pseudocyphellaria aurata]